MHLNHLYEIWECEWDEMTKTDNEIKEMIKIENDIRPDFGFRPDEAELMLPFFITTSKMMKK